MPLTEDLIRQVSSQPVSADSLSGRLGIQEAIIRQLDKAVEELTVKLSPVLGPEPPATPNQLPEASPPSSPLAKLVGSHNGTLGELTRRLGQLAARIDL